MLLIQRIDDIVLMSAPVSLNLLNELRGKKEIKYGALPSILSLFRNKFNKFTNSGVY